MSGDCAHCKEMQKKIPDYCCVLCVLKKTGLPAKVTQENGTTIIDLSSS